MYQPEFERLINFGHKVTEGQDDAQYMFLNQRLCGIEESWEGLEKMCDDREAVLNQSLQAQVTFQISYCATTFPCFLLDFLQGCPANRCRAQQTGECRPEVGLAGEYFCHCPYLCVCV